MLDEDVVLCAGVSFRSVCAKKEAGHVFKLNMFKCVMLKHAQDQR